MTDDGETNAVILFDGVCVLCEHSVQFIIRHDPDAYFCFAALQSEAGQALVKANQDQLAGVDTDSLESFVLLQGGRAYCKSEAWFRIVASLHGGWRWFRYFGILPRVMTDFFYDLIGRYRYRIFGQRDVCLVPDESLRQRFLDDSSRRGSE